MLKITMAVLLTAAFIGAAVAGPRKDLLISYKQQLTDNCMGRAAQTRSMADAAARCGCVTEMTARFMSLKEIIELEEVLDAGTTTDALPQVRRILPKLDTCPR